ncbi:putative kinase domain protein [Blattamonas nauphoetae]|uniref:Kinase domain protein n=1 Tax=Blattamonas nauphoetae TaxID=2049346 RepID=A0ABQ9X0K3_9EUKA|nr:putative kinase domain protein [Blattamonas nauphoetae]
MTTHQDFSLPEYWEQVYSSGKEVFDFYLRFEHLAELFSRYLKENSSILYAGCGTSAIGFELFSKGHTNVTCYDSNAELINHLQLEAQELDIPINYDTVDLLTFENPEGKKFDIILDKATLDCILCSSNHAASSKQYLSTIRSLLGAGGVFICISHGSSEFRNEVFENNDYAWDLLSETISTDNGTNYFIYILTARDDSPPTGEAEPNLETASVHDDPVPETDVQDPISQPQEEEDIPEPPPDEQADGEIELDVEVENPVQEPEQETDEKTPEDEPPVAEDAADVEIDESAAPPPDEELHEEDPPLPDSDNEEVKEDEEKAPEPPAEEDVPPPEVEDEQEVEIPLEDDGTEIALDTEQGEEADISEHLPDDPEVPEEPIEETPQEEPAMDDLDQNEPDPEEIPPEIEPPTDTPPESGDNQEETLELDDEPDTAPPPEEEAPQETHQTSEPEPAPVSEPATEQSSNPVQQSSDELDMEEPPSSDFSQNPNHYQSVASIAPVVVSEGVPLGDDFNPNASSSFDEFDEMGGVGGSTGQDAWLMGDNY